MTDHRILVTGSRDWNDREAIRVPIARWIGMNLVNWQDGDRVVLVHGACGSGADLIAEEVFEEMMAVSGQFVVERHPADWNTFGPGAGPIRNQEMVNLGAEVCFAFIGPCTSQRCKRTDPHPSHGASGAAALAERAGIPTQRFYLTTQPDAATL